MTTTTDTYVIPSMRGEEYGTALNAEAAAEGHQAGMWHDETACGLPHSDRDAGQAACDRDWTVGVPLDLDHAAAQTPQWRTGYRLRHEQLVIAVCAA